MSLILKPAWVLIRQRHLPSVQLKSVSPSETVSFRLAADRVCLCRERRECDPPDSTPCNRVQGVASVVGLAGSRDPAAHVGNFLPSVPLYHFAKVIGRSSAWVLGTGESDGKLPVDAKLTILPERFCFGLAVVFRSSDGAAKFSSPPVVPFSLSRR
jgi:hypothetical protein